MITNYLQRLYCIPSDFASAKSELQYVSNDNHYGRIKVGGKIIRETLETNVWTTAKLRLTDFLKEHQETRNETAAPTFREAVERFKRDLETDTGIKPQSKQYRLWCLRKIELSWPGLWDLRCDKITEQNCREWAAHGHDFAGRSL